MKKIKSFILATFACIGISTMPFIVVPFALSCSTNQQPQLSVNEIVNQVDNNTINITSKEEQYTSNTLSTINEASLLSYLNGLPAVEGVQYSISNFVRSNIDLTTSEKCTISFNLVVSKDNETKTTKTISVDFYFDKAELSIELISANMDQYELIPNPITQEELDAINEDNILSNIKNLELDKINCDYEIVPNTLDKKTPNIISFTLKVSNKKTKYSDEIYLSVSYQLDDSSSVPSSKVEKYIQEINKANFVIDSTKMKRNTFVEEFSYLNNSNALEILQNYIKKFDYLELSKNARIEIPYYVIDPLDYVIKMKIKLTDINNTNQTATSNVKTIKYQPKQEDIGELDKSPDENEVKVPTSYKGKLEILGNLTVKGFSNVRDTLEKYMNNYENINWKVKELLYQIRFIFYQSFNDNATSIDYGIESINGENITIILKAKIKESKNIKPYIQVLTDANNNIQSQTLNPGDIVTIKLSTSLNEKYSLAEGGSILPTFESAFSFGQGNKEQIIQQARQDLPFGTFGQCNLNISINNKNITSNQLSLRTFSFMFPMRKKVSN